MKKILTMALAALSLLAITEQQAKAWSKYNFGVGLNLGWEGAGNSVFMGMFKGQAAPGTDGAGYGGGGYMGRPGYGAYPGMQPYGAPGYGNSPGYGGDPSQYPGAGTEPPLAPTNEPEKVPAPTPVRPAAYNFYPQQMNYYPPMPASTGYPTYPSYPAVAPMPGYPTYPTYPAYPVSYGR